MDSLAPITWLINQITNLVSSGIGSASSGVANVITPLAAAGFGIYIILITINYMRGSETEPVLDFGMRMVGFALIIGLGLNADNYQSTIVPMVTGIGGDIANAISNGTVSSNTLDTLARQYLKIIDDGFYAAASNYDPFTLIAEYILVGLKALLIIFTLAPFLIAATMAMIIANVGSILVVMVGPLFFAFLMFPATRQYFSAWVNTALSYALIPVFIAVIATISVGLSQQMIGQIEGSTTLVDVPFSTVFLAGLGNLTLLFLLKQVSSLASSLSAGGINAGMAGGVGAAATAIRNAGRGTGQDIKSIGKAYDAYKNYRASKKDDSNSIRKAG